MIVAEDTRRTRKLLTHYGIHIPLTSCHEHNEVEKAETLLEKLKSGLNIALVTDAGTPGVSDPGSHITRVALTKGVRVVPVPGVCAAVTALSCSGLPSDSFSFYGFLPRQSAKRKIIMRHLCRETKTFVVYESTKRLLGTLRELMAELGDRRMLLARELTKVFEELKCGRISEVLADLEGKDIKGEVTLVFEGGSESEPPGEEAIMRAIRWYRENSGAKLNAIARRVAQELGVAKNEVYRLGLAIEKKEARVE